MPGSNSETRVRFYDDFGINIVVQYSVRTIISFHSRITAREYVGRLGNQVYPMFLQTLFLNNDADFQDNSAPFTQLELFSHGLKSMKVNFNIFLGQHNHHI
jgi:hypothetical protein